MPPKKPPTPPVEDDGGPPPPTWEDNLGLSELQSAPWAPFAYILHSTGDGPAEEGTEPPSLHKYVLDALSSREDLGNLTILDKDALVAETIEAASAKGAEPPKEGSAVAAVVEAGAEGATPEMVAALIQEKWLEHMAADIEAKSASSEPAATDDAEAEAPAEEEAAVAEAPAEDSSSAADRVYLFVGWPNTADEICALSKRGVTIHGSFHLTNTPVPGEDGVMPDAAPPHDLLTAVTEAKKGPITDAADPLVDFVWSEIVVPPQPPPPEEGTPEDTPPEPSPADIASTTLRERLPLLWKQTCQFRDVMSKFKTSSIPSMASDYDMGYYTRMMDTIPVSHITVPLVLDVMFEQVCLNRKGSNATDEATAEYRKEEIANFLDSAEASLTGLQMNNNGAEASTGPPSLTLLRHGDEMGFRSTGGQLQARVEESVQRVRDLLALPGDRFKDVFPLKKKTESERGSERTELYHYTNALAPPIVERALMLNEFEKFAKPDEVSDDIAKEGPFVDRTVMEFFGRDTLAQVVENAQMLEVEEKMTHYADHDVCLYNVVRRVPNERIKEKDINVELPLRPQLSEWIKQTCCDEWVSSVAKLSEASYVEPKDQIVISQSSDEPKMCLQSRLTYPADNSLVQTRGAVGGGDSTVFTETVTCGLRTEEEGAITHSRFYSSFDDGSVCSVRMVGEADAPIMHVQVTGREGVTVIVTSDGKVQQLKHQHRDTHAAGDVKSVPEVQRAVLADGTVVRQVGEGDSAQLECLYADGNTAVRGSDSCWVRTNLGGARLMVDPAGKQYFMPPVSTASSTDFQTQSEIYTRGDGTTVVTHKDGTRIVKHADGTSLTVRDADITAEADGFSTVTAHTDSCGFTVQMPDSTVISKTTDADTGASIMTLKKMSGELCRCELVASSGEQLVSVYPSMQAKTDGTPHSFDLSIGAFSNVDGHGNAFRSGHDDLGAAVDLYHDPSLDVQELEDDRNAVVARRVFVLGAPRSGKTTTCEHLNKRYGHQVVSMAAVLREATETDMPDTGWPEGSLPGEVQTLIEESDDGSPVFSDDLLTRLLQARLAQEDCANGWVLDGYPTTLSQADALRSASIVPQKVIMLSCPDEHCEARADPDQCIAPPAPEPEGDDPPPAPLSPHASAVATFRTVEEALKTKFSGMCTVVDAAPPFAPGRPNQSFDKMLLSAKLCLRPENFGGRVQVAVSGLPGAGCTEQSVRLMSSYGCVVLDAKAEDGETILSDAEAAAKILAATESEECKQYGWVVDGWPRTTGGVDAATAAGLRFQKIILLGELDDEEAGRRLTEQAGGGEAAETACKARIEAFNEGKDDLVQAFEGDDTLLQVDAGTSSVEGEKASMDEVEKRVKEAVEVALYEASVAHLPRIFLLGPPGAGKTICCRKVSEAFGCVSINMAVLVEEEAAKGEGDLSAECSKVLQEGGRWKDVSDEVLVKLLDTCVRGEECKKRGYVVDGFPRNGAQAEALRELGTMPRAVVTLEVAEDLAVERCTGRRIDPSTLTWDGYGTYHLTFMPAENVDVHERLEQQPWDWDEAAREQLEAYGEGIEELKELYEPVLHTVDGSGDVDTVVDLVLGVLPSQPVPTPPPPPEPEPLPHASERLFVLHVDGSGFELLERSEVDQYIERKSADHATTVIKEAVAGDETSTCYTFFTQKRPQKFSAPPGGEGNVLPKVLASLEGDDTSAARIYEYRQFRLHQLLDEDERLTLKEALAKHADMLAEKGKTGEEVVVDLRTTDEREAEFAMHERVKAALQRDTGNDERDASGKLPSREEIESSHSARIKTPGGSVRRVQFDTVAAEAKPPPKRKGANKGLRPSFPVHRQDMLQYPNYTEYFEGDDGAAFQAEHGSIAPAAEEASKPQEMVEDGRIGDAMPMAGTQDFIGGTVRDTPHPLEDAVPLPRTSNMQVLEPITDSYPNEGWESYQVPQGTRGLGMHPPRDVYGNERTRKVPVPATLKMAPATEANERYAVVEDPVRRQLKTMSAQSLQMGGVGVGGRDPSRGFLVHPTELRFGRVSAGNKYVLRLTLMNAGIDGSRFQIRKPKGIDVRYKTGMVAAGMTVMLQVVLGQEESGEVDDQIQIVTENEVFRLPISATVLSSQEFNQLEPNQRTKAAEFALPPKAEPLSRAAPEPEYVANDGEDEEQQEEQS